jgi:DNA-binding protein HU-beta
VNKNDLVNQVSAASGLSKAGAAKAVETVLEAITEALAKREEVRLVGFGTFSTAERKATQGRNPRTGEPMEIPATTVPKFKPGKDLKDSVAV